jgi:hypothetical protein
MTLYAGGESSRIYEGRYVVRAWFLWPDGQPGEHDTAPLPYEDCLDWLASAPHVPLVVVDDATGEIHQVRVQRAVILEEHKA